MCSAFWRGVALLNKSNTDVGQPQRKTLGPPGLLAGTSSFSEVPKNVKALQPVICKLIDKVI
jgi:hypothetical protein